MTNPIATIIIATRNGSATISAAIESALSQDTKFPYQIVLIDDGSTDLTYETACLAVEKYARPRQMVKLVKVRSTIGLPRACNAGLCFAKGDFVTRLDDDDILPPDALSLLLPMLDKGHADWSYGDRLAVDQETGQARRVCVGYPLAHGWISRLSACGVMMRRDLLDHLGGYRDMFWHEYDLYLRYMTSAARRPVHYVPRPVYVHGARPSGASGADANMREGWRELAEAWGAEKLRDFGFSVPKEAQP